MHLAEHSNIEPAVLIHQLGGRLHYAAAKGLHAAGILSALVTDIHIPKSGVWGEGTRLGRYSSGLPKDKVICDRRLGSLYRAIMRLGRPRAGWPHLYASEELARTALEIVDRRHPNTIYGFDTAMLPLMRALSYASHPLFVLEQCIVPRATQMEFNYSLGQPISKQAIRFARMQLSQHAAIEKEEWKLADYIICPSTFVEQELIRWGCRPEKLRVVPYGYTPIEYAHSPKSFKGGPLEIIFVGTVGYRKGILDLGHVAARLGSQVRVKALGAIGISNNELSDLSRSIEFRGPVSFNSVVAAFRNAHVLVLPSYFEGSATVVYEAMAHGLPCIVTRQTGTVITNNEDGIIIEAGDRSALESALRLLIDSPGLVERLSSAALDTARYYSLERYGVNLASALRSFFAPAQSISL